MASPRKLEFHEISIVTDSLAEEVKRLWLRNKVVDHQAINERVREVAMTITSDNNELAGVSTVRKVRLSLLNNNYVFELRCFIDPAFRQPALDTKLVIKTKEFLERSSQGHPERPIGLIMVVENEILKQWTRTVWAGADFYFAGFTSHGHHIRVSY